MKSFLQGKKNLGVGSLRPPAQLSAVRAQPCDTGQGSSASTSRHGGGGAQVEVVKEGDKVVRLIVNCGCGERIEIECLYSAGR